jgi:hypothetical protein
MLADSRVAVILFVVFTQRYRVMRAAKEPLFGIS